MQARHISRSGMDRSGRSKNSERNYKTRRLAAAHATERYRVSLFRSELWRTPKEAGNEEHGTAQQQKTWRFF
jgi:hypothetical protein